METDSLNYYSSHDDGETLNYISPHDDVVSHPLTVIQVVSNLSTPPSGLNSADDGTDDDADLSSESHIVLPQTFSVNAWMSNAADSINSTPNEQNVFEAASNVLSTSESAKYLPEVIHVLGDVQDSCMDDFKKFCMQQPPMQFTSHVNSILDAMMESASTNSNPVVTWYRRHLREQHSLKVAENSGEHFLQELQHKISPHHILRHLTGKGYYHGNHASKVTVDHGNHGHEHARDRSEEAESSSRRLHGGHFFMRGASHGSDSDSEGDDHRGHNHEGHHNHDQVGAPGVYGGPEGLGHNGEPSDSYLESIGFGAMGDNCMMANYASLSNECQNSISNLSQLRDSYIQEVRAMGKGPHGCHHHPWIFFLLIGSGAYMLYKRHQKMRKIRQILNVIDANPALKQQVEAAAGCEIPAHNSGLEVCGKKLGRVVLCLVTFFFVALTSVSMAAVVVHGINMHRDHLCQHEHHGVNCEPPVSKGTAVLILALIAAAELIVLSYIGYRVKPACCGAAEEAEQPTTAEDSTHPTSAGMSWYPGQMYASLPSESAHGGSEMRTFSANTGTQSVVTVTNTPIREVRPMSQVTML